VGVFQELLGMYSRELALKDALARDFPLLQQRSHAVLYSAAFLNEPYLVRSRITEAVELVKVEMATDLLGEAGRVL